MSSSVRRLPSGLFTTAEALDAGWTPSAQRHAVDTGRWNRLRPGVFDLASAPDPRRYAQLRADNLRSAQATARGCPRAVLSQTSAAIAQDLPVIGRPVRQPCVTVQSGTALRTLAHVHLHRATLLDEDVTEIDGYRVTTPARTVVDIAREHGRTAGVVAADNALHRRLTTPGELAAMVERQRGWPRSAVAASAVAFADGRAESPLESISRVRMDEHGLPRPTLQAVLCDEWGVPVARSDFYWPEFGVAGESDGMLKYVNGRPAVEGQDEQQTYLERLGLIWVRWGWKQLTAFDGVARRLELAFPRGFRPGTPERRWRVQLTG